MSGKTVDERVVSMQFDNKNFEKNVQTSLSTLDKLKQSLNFTGATKGLENIDSATKNINMSGLSSAVETVASRFSSLDVIGVTALMNITNTAVNAGRRMLHSLTVAPISQGFDEYELKMGSVQTIMASTGASLDEVNKYLEELNVYADKTIYSFSDMTNNIGKFTNAGVSLKDSVAAIQGVSNVAAVSGANANQASHAMYNFAQALSAGYVKLIDWKSIETANMSTVEFRNQLLETAISCGTVQKTSDGMYKVLSKNSKGSTMDGAISATKNFNDSLSYQWMTTEVLTKTLGKYSDETTEIGKKSFAAAQDVKTFNQLIDTLQEAVGSGWAQSFELVVGDFNEAKAFFTQLSDIFGGMIQKSADARNNMLKSALDSKWGQFTEKINKAGVSTDVFQKKLTSVAKTHNVSIDKMIKEEGSFEKVIKKGRVSTDLIIETLKSLSKTQKTTTQSTEDMNKKLKKFQKVVKDVWNGDYKNGEERVKALTKAGYKYNEVQSLVNKTAKGQKITLDDLSKSQLKSVGYTDKEIKAINELASEAEKAGTPINDLINSLSKPSGRELLHETFINSIQAMLKPLNALSDAWHEIFAPKSGDRLYSIIETLHTFSSSLVLTDESADKLKRTFKGVFAILDMIMTFTGGGLKLASTVVLEFMKALGLSADNVLDLTANIGDAVVKVRDWIDEHSILAKGIKAVVPLVVKFAKAASKFIESIYKMPEVQGVITSASQAFHQFFNNFGKYIQEGIKRFDEFVDRFGSMDSFSVDNIIKALKDFKKNVIDYFLSFDGLFDNVPDNILSGFSNGLSAGSGKVFEVIKKIGSGLVEAICAVLGIESPSKVFMGIGVFAILGLIMGLSNGSSSLYDIITHIGDNLTNILNETLQNGVSPIMETFKNLWSTINNFFQQNNLDFSKLFVMGSVVGILLLLKKLTTTLDGLVTPIKSINGVIDKFGGVLSSFSKMIDAKTMNMKSEAIYTIAKAIAVLAGSLAILSQMDQEALWSSVGALSVMTAVMGALIFAMTKMGKVEGIAETLKSAKLGGLMLKMAASITILAYAMKVIAGMSESDLTQGITVIGGAMTLMIGMVYLFKYTGDNIQYADAAGNMFIKISASIMILSYALKSIASMSWEDIGKGATVIGGTIALFGALILLFKFIEHDFANVNQVGGMFIKMSIAIGILAVVLRMLSGISNEDAVKGLGIIATIEAFFVAFIGITELIGNRADQAGAMLLKMSIAIGILVVVMKLIASLSVGDITKGVIVIGAIGVFFATFIAITNFIGPNADQAGAMLLKMSIAIGILVVVMKLIASLSVGDIVKGLATMTLVGALFYALVGVSKYAGENASQAGTMLLKMSAAMLILAGAIALLSLLKPTDIAVGTVAIAAMMGMFAILIKSTEHSKDSVKTLTTLIAAFAALVAGVAILSALDTGSVVAVSASLSLLVGAFSLLIKSTSKIGTKAMGSILVMTAVVGLLGGLLYVLSGLPIKSTLAVSTALSTLLISMSASFAIFSSTGGMATNVLPALAAMLGAVALLAVILGVMVKLDVAPSIETATALSILLLAMSGACLILSAVGGVAPAAIAGAGALDAVIVIIGGLMVGIGALAKYVPEMESFLDKGIALLIKMGKGLGEALGSFASSLLTSATADLDKVGLNLSKFMINATPFIMGAKLIDANVANGIKSLAETILILTGADILDGLTSWFTGGSSIVEFGDDLAAFGPKLKDYSDAVKDVKPESIVAASKAAKAIAEMTDSIPNSKGVVQWFAGEKSVASFAENLPTLGINLKKFSKSVEGVSPENVTAAANAAKALAEMTKILPNEKGFKQYVSGENSLSTFSSRLPGLGTNLKKFATATEGITSDKIKPATQAAKTLAEMADIAPDDTSNVYKLGDSLNQFSQKLKTFFDNLSGVSEEKVNNSNKVLKFIKDVTAIQPGNLKSLSDSMSSLQKSISDISKIKTKSLTGAISTLKNIGSEKNATTIKAGGVGLMKAFNNGINSQKETIKKSCTSIANACVEAIKKTNESSKKAGKNFVKGFANGVNDNVDLAENAGYSVGRSAVKGAKAATNEHSPSKEAEKIGKFFDVGFVNGIKKLASKVYDSSYSVGERAKIGLSNSISKIADMIDSDIDSQPTIRPVLDLSGVSSGAGAINDMFNITPSIGVLSNVGAINRMMGNRQNGNNDEVVSAIKDLKRSIGKTSGDTYSINGITYSNGTEVSEAIQTLVRAAKVDRRT